MAEGFLRALYSARYKAYSAGIEPTRVNPYAIKVMAEIDIDISRHLSKSVEEFRGMKFDYVATVYDYGKETCPFFPSGKRYLHKGFDKPSDFIGREDEKMALFRRMRDEIRGWVEKTFGEEHKKAKGA